MSVTVNISAGDVNDHGNWDAFCRITGISYWAMNEGRLDRDEVFSFSLDQVEELQMSRWLSRVAEVNTDSQVLFRAKQHVEYFVADVLSQLTDECLAKDDFPSIGEWSDLKNYPKAVKLLRAVLDGDCSILLPPKDQNHY